MRFFVTPLIFLAAASTAYVINSSSNYANGTAALQILSFLHQLDVSILAKLAEQTNSTAFHQASEVSRVSRSKRQLMFNFVKEGGSRPARH